MATRRGPKDGYGFGRKRDYRRKIWATFRAGLKRNKIVVADAHALLMPSIEGDEIEVALNAGFREQNLHVVDDNPAIVATLRRKYRRIHTYGVDVVRAAQRIRDGGITLAVANLDLCGQLSNPLLHAVTGLVGAEVLAPIAYIAITQLRGRESKQALWLAKYLKEYPTIGGDSDQWNRVIGDLADTDQARAAAIKKFLSYRGQDVPHRYTVPVRAEVYNSASGQSMLWTAWQVVPNKSVAVEALTNCNAAYGDECVFEIGVHKALRRLSTLPRHEKDAIVANMNKKRSACLEYFANVFDIETRLLSADFGLFAMTPESECA